MKKLIIILIFTIIAYAKLNVAVSIAPQAYLLENIAKDKVDILTVVKAGSSPHTYEPKPSQMIKLSKTNLYFAIGVEFENVWLNKFKEQNSNMQIIHCDKNITKIPMIYGEDKGKLDPHIWLSVSNLKIIAQNITNTLINKDNANSAFYTNNLKILLEKLDKLDKKIKEELLDLKNRKFLVFHPSWGYFAKEYNLEQLAIEIEGKKPKPKELIKIIELAKQESIKVIFAQPEFSQKSSQIIANEIKGKVVKISPLTKNVIENLKNFADALVKGENH